MTKRISLDEAKLLLDVTEAELTWLRRQGFLDLDQVNSVAEGQVQSLIPDLPDLRARMGDMKQRSPQQLDELMTTLRSTMAVVVLGSIVSRTLLRGSGVGVAVSILCAMLLLALAGWKLVLHVQKRKTPAKPS
jgi:hypothetical protein